MKNRTCIVAGHDWITTKRQIRQLMMMPSTPGPLCIDLDLDSCSGGVAFELLALSNLLKTYPGTTTARINGIASIVPLIGADIVEMDEKALIHITPLKMAVVGDIRVQRSASETLDAVSHSISEALKIWPEAQKIFDDGEERFLSRPEAIDMGIVNDGK